MTHIRLISNSEREIRPLVEAALTNESRLVQAGVQQTEQRHREFENKYDIMTQEFVSRYDNDEFEETLEFGEWIGEFRVLLRLREKVEALKDIRFAD